ncbi:exosortase-associated protein EpsI, V-type [Sphingomonas sp. TX0543]|uniref:exosortase-associated protein EpsI, V-type n=1 Tax=unclassified Sphingomonas TaxID=196159 RepID=UPI002016612D|nr:exosortase-associated protein EpsI, V-type [Sphingomonas sp. 3P27F8]
MNEESWLRHAGQGEARATRREALLGGAMIAVAAAGFALKPRRIEKLLGNAKLESLVPDAFGGWKYQAASGLVLPPADQMRDKIYSQLVTRAYTRADGASVMLLIAYSGAQDGTIQVHRPEVCYPASGYKLTTIAQHETPLAPGVAIPSRYIVAEADLRREQLIYWTRVGDYFPTKWSAQRGAVVRENFAGVIPDGVLVRVSTVGSGDESALLDGFARDLYAAIGLRLRQVLVGMDRGTQAPKLT